MKKVSFIKGAFRIVLIVVFGLTLFIAIKSRFPGEKYLEKAKIGIGNIVRYFPFSKENSLKEWEEKIFKGKVIYAIEKGDSLSYVSAKSEKTASALYYKLKLDVDRHPVISWKWLVHEFPKRTRPEAIESKKEEDFAARVYVIFPAAFFTNSKSIEYIWAETLPKGTSGRSGYTKNIKVLVLESGKASDWCFEERDICADYIKLFGEKPRLDVGAIAFMTDADSTQTSAGAVYDEIEIGYE